jgi:hypothetical protein
VIPVFRQHTPLAGATRTAADPDFSTGAAQPVGPTCTDYSQVYANDIPAFPTALLPRFAQRMHRLFASVSTGFAQFIHRLVNRFIHSMKEPSADTRTHCDARSP